MNNMEHKFNINIAEVIGLEASIILNNLIFWVKHNEANNTNFHDGRYWTFNSVEAYKKLFPYLTKHKIINALKQLEDANLIYIGSYNKSSYDRTKWYSVNQQHDLLKNGNGETENQITIPDNKTEDIKTKDNKTTYINYNHQNLTLEDSFNLFWNVYNKKVDTSKCKEKFIKLSVKEIEIILKVVKNYVDSTPDIKYRKNPLTWLNRECWNDEIQTESNTQELTFEQKKEIHRNSMAY